MLKKKVLTGVKWVAFANIFGQILSLVSIVIFAKILTPDDFGVFAILMIFIGFLNIFSDMGTASAIIHIQKPSNLLLSSIFYFNLFVGTLLTIILMSLAGTIAVFFENTQLEFLLQVISLNFIIVSFTVVQKALLQKDIDFKHLSLIQSFAMFSGIIIGILSALYGLGVLSLIIQTLTTTTISTIFIWFYSSWRPKLSFSLNEIKKIWSYTANLSAFEFINYFSRNADSFIIGKYLTSSALGVYSLAYRIMLYPLQNISRILMRVLFPAFSTLQNDDKRFRKAYLRLIFFISLISFPIMTGLMAISNVLVDVLFGTKWDGLALLLIVLAPAGMMRSIFTTVGTVYMAKGHTKKQFQVGLVNTIVIVLGFIIAIPYGVTGIAISYSITHAIMFYPVLSIAWSIVGLDIKDGLKELAPVLIISLIMSISVYFIDIQLLSMLENQIIRLLLMIILGIILYLGMLRFQYGKLTVFIKEIKS